MRRIGVVIAALAMLVAGLGQARADDAADGADPAAGPSTRAYTVHVPPGEFHPGRPLVVYLHGCIQTAAQAEAATHFDDLADRYDFVVAYPQQNVTANSSAPLADGNGVGCWNWFLPQDQERDQGEPAAIAAITREVMADQQIDPSRVYVEGISAGADMAVILAAAYPDLYAAVGAVEGCPYRTCTDATGALAYQAMGDRARVVPMFTVQGTADTLNAAPLGQSLVESWLGLSDLADNGSPDGSIARTPSAVENRSFDQAPQPGSGDACVRNQNWPCPGGVVGFQGSYPATVSTYVDRNWCAVVESWLVHGMEHGQPNASSGPFTDPLGPDITAASYEFFAKHTMGGCS